MPRIDVQKKNKKQNNFENKSSAAYQDSCGAPWTSTVELDSSIIRAGFSKYFFL